MKILTKEEERAHYDATLRGGFLGGFLGLTAGTAAVTAAHLRFPTFRSLTLPLKAFLVTSTGTFGAIIQADRASRAFEVARRPEERYKDKSQEAMEAARSSESSFKRFMDWGRENRYSIVGASWVASMGIALGLVGRNPYLTGQQKLVQARVYAQGLTLAVLFASATFEIGDANKGKGRWETVKVLDPNDPDHKRMIEKKVHHEAYAGEDLWRDMVEAEERKQKERERAVHKREEKDIREGKVKPKKHPKDSEGKQDKQDHSSGDSQKDGKKQEQKSDREEKSP